MDIDITWSKFFGLYAPYAIKENFGVGPQCPHQFLISFIPSIAKLYGWRYKIWKFELIFKNVLLLSLIEFTIYFNYFITFIFHPKLGYYKHGSNMKPQIGKQWTGNKNYISKSLFWHFWKENYLYSHNFSNETYILW